MDSLLKTENTHAQVKPLFRINHFQKYENSTTHSLKSLHSEDLKNSDITVLPDGDLGLDMERAFQLGAKYSSEKVKLKDGLLFNRAA